MGLELTSTRRVHRKIRVAHVRIVVSSFPSVYSGLSRPQTLTRPVLPKDLAPDEADSLEPHARRGPRSLNAPLPVHELKDDATRFRNTAPQKGSFQTFAPILTPTFILTSRNPYKGHGHDSITYYINTRL